MALVVNSIDTNFKLKIDAGEESLDFTFAMSLDL